MSSSTTYLTSCPKCGAQLTPIAVHPDSTPWACYECHLGFWVSELSHEAREMYRHQLHDWGHGAAPNALRAKVLEERNEARNRGTSALPEHLGMLPKDHLKRLQRLVLHKDFAKLVKGAL